jgi:hypothetical protein
MEGQHNRRTKEASEARWRSEKKVMSQVHLTIGYGHFDELAEGWWRSSRAI